MSAFLFLLLTNPTFAAGEEKLRCELTLLSQYEEQKETTNFSVSLGKPEQGEFRGYSYYITYQKTTKRAATYQLSRDNGFFVHGSSLQPEAGASFSGLGFDGVAKNSVYLGCEAQ